jgi:hypothetical protein
MDNPLSGSLTVSSTSSIFSFMAASIAHPRAVSRGCQEDAEEQRQRD